MKKYFFKTYNKNVTKLSFAKIPQTNKKAFTLVEIVIALFVLSLLSLATYKIYTSSIRAEKQSKNYFKALNLASTKIEELLITNENGSRKEKEKIFNIEWKVESQKISVTVIWQERGEKKSLNLKAAPIQKSYFTDTKNGV